MKKYAISKFWKEIMEKLLGEALYHGVIADEKSWVIQYEHEVSNMIDDIKAFCIANTQAGMEISNETMARFLIYTEFQHIGNDRLVRRHAIDETKLCEIAANIIDEIV